MMSPYISSMFDGADTIRVCKNIIKMIQLFEKHSASFGESENFNYDCIKDRLHNLEENCICYIEEYKYDKIIDDIPENKFTYTVPKKAKLKNKK